MRVPPRKSNRRERCSINRVVSTLLVLAVLAVTGSIKLAVRVHSGSNNLQEQTHILITLEERPLSSSRLSVMSQADASRSLTHQSRDQEHSNASQEQSQRIRPLTNATSSACMLIMDDNHWLVEWRKYSVNGSGLIMSCGFWGLSLISCFDSLFISCLSLYHHEFTSHDHCH